MNRLARISVILICLIYILLGIAACSGREFAAPPNAQVVARSSEIGLGLTEVKWSPADPDSLILRGESITPSGLQSPIYLLNLKSKTISPLKQNGKQISAIEPSWSFDGKLIGFFDLEAQQMRIITIDDTLVTKTFSIPNGHMILAPSGQQFAVFTYEHSSVMASLLDIQGHNLDVLLNFSDASLQGVSSSAWSPTGEYIAFAMKYASNTKDRPQGDLYLLSVKNKSLLRITSTPLLDEGEPAWSPDGHFLAFTSHPIMPSMNWNLMITNADGSCPKNISNLAGFHSPSWSPDGNQLAVISTEGDVYIINVSSLDVDLSKQRLTC